MPASDFLKSGGGDKVAERGKKELQKSQEDRAAGWAVLCIFGVLFASWGAYCVVAAALLLGRIGWLEAHLTPAGRTLAIWSGFGLVPLCLLLATLRRARLPAGMGFFAVSGVFTFVTATACAIYVYYLWSWPGLVLGTLMVGYGILPLAMLGAALHHQWTLLGSVVSGGIMMFSTLYFGLALMTLSFSGDPVRQPPPPDSEADAGGGDAGS